MEWCIPVIPSADLEKSLRLWINGLGFSPSSEMREEGKLIFCMLQKNDLYFMLNRRAGTTVQPDDYNGIRLYWTPEDIDKTRGRLKNLGYDVSEIVRRDYGQTEFLLTDDDGYSHCFGVSTEPKPAYLRSIEAQLYVADVNASCAFFTSKLGFSVAFKHGDPPFYAQVRRDNARLNLRLVREAVFADGIRERERLLSASIVVLTSADLEKLYLEFRATDVRFSQELKTEPWGAMTFVASDPDGNLILFAGPGE
jgi:catechol 2,3-dioxygenase-like lactoylglutathione lyase family enzyme